MQSLAYVHLTATKSTFEERQGISQPANARRECDPVLFNLRAYAAARKKTVTQARHVRRADAMILPAQAL